MKYTLRKVSQLSFDQVQEGTVLMDEIMAGCQQRIADSLEEIVRWGYDVDLCKTARTLPVIARILTKPFRIRHEFVLRIELPEIHWPWKKQKKQKKHKKGKRR